MNLLKLPIRSIMVYKWRSMTIGIFIFVVSVYMLFFSTFITSVTGKMENVIIHALTGEIQIRPLETKENDMVVMGSMWDEVAYFSGNKVRAIESFLQEHKSVKEYTRQVRHNVLFVSDTAQQPVMVIGGDLGVESYKKAVTLTKGRFLDPQSSHEVILSKSQTENLKVNVGDTIGVLAHTHSGYIVDSALTVVGIGDVAVLSSFGFSVAYTDLGSAQELMGFTDEEVSDIIVFAHRRQDALRLAKELDDALGEVGTGAVKAKISTWKTMGGFIMGIVGMTKGIFYAFIGLLMFIISILIANIVYLMSLERYREIGTMRAIGFGRWKIIQIFVSEILIITGFFTVVGIVAGTGVIMVFSKVGLPPFFTGMEYIMGDRLYLFFNIKHIVPVIVVQFTFSFLACFYPSYKASIIQPTEAMSQA